MCQVESETAKSELKLSNTTGRLLQLEIEVGLLRQNNLEMKEIMVSTEQTTQQAKQDADEAEQVSQTRTSDVDLHVNYG